LNTAALTKKKGLKAERKFKIIEEIKNIKKYKRAKVCWEFGLAKFTI
jgi:hypothetical protein